MTRALRELAEMERRWAERPAKADWLPPAPHWWTDTNAYAPMRLGSDRLWHEGAITWGRVLMANNAIWQPGAGAFGGEVIWSDDPYVLRFPEWLEGPSRAYWTLREKGSAAPGLRALVPFARNEMRAAHRATFPSLLSQGRAVWHATLFVYREHLPTGYLVDARVPLVRVRSGVPSMVAIAPVAYWPAELRRTWEDAASRARTDAPA